jgi:type II secretory pathway pseudopilin PulG
MKRLLVTTRRRGFSLVEVLVGMVILMMALASAAALSVSNANLIAKNQFAVHAENLAEAKMEELRNMTTADVVDGDDGGTINTYGALDANGAFTRSWEVVDTNFQVAGLKRVIVTVNWNQGGLNQSYVLAGVLGDAV